MADLICLDEVLIDFVPPVTPTTLIDARRSTRRPAARPRTWRWRGSVDRPRSWG
jgi:hypothetical protein